jgi:hypothetical protein
MTEQIFPVGTEPRVLINQVCGDLRVRAWEMPTLRLDTDTEMQERYFEGDTLTIVGCADDLELRVPPNTEISVSDLQGDAWIAGVRRVELTSVSGDIQLRHIAEMVEVFGVTADLDVAHTPTLLAHGEIGGNVMLAHVTRAEIEAVATDLTANQVETLVVGLVGGDLEVERLATALRCGSVGRNCELQGSPTAEITINTIGGDLEVAGAARLHISDIGGDCDLGNIRDAVQVVRIGRDAGFTDIGTSLQVGEVGVDVEIKDAHGTISIGSIGGDLELCAPFLPDSHARLNVSGDAEITFPDNPNLHLQATVGGEVSGYGAAAHGEGQMLNLSYGVGAARLELTVAGNLLLRSPHSPHSSSGLWSDVEREISEFGREMGKLGQDLGREMGKLGQDLGLEFGSLFGGKDKETPPWEDWTRQSRKARRRAHRMQQRAGRHARRAYKQAEKHARQQAEPETDNPRMHVRFNDREWWFDPERLEHIKEQARRAATEGVSEALEAVERAINKLHVPGTPPPSEQASSEQVPPESSSASTETTASEGTAATEPATRRQQEQPPAHPQAGPQQRDIEKEREAILRLVAEGRITPEEGDLLLEALES